VPFSSVPSTPAAALGDELVRVTKLLHVAKSQAPRKHPHVDPMAYPLLFNLKRCPMRVSALADAVHVDVSTVSRQVSTLVDHGLVARGPDPDDGRAQALSITDDGAALLLAIRDGREQWLRDLLTDWSDDEVRQLTAQLSRFASALEATLTTPTTTTTRNDA
jgi:DNA-binding MarR family transcriptional regulator